LLLIITVSTIACSLSHIIYYVNKTCLVKNNDNTAYFVCNSHSVLYASDKMNIIGDHVVVYTLCLKKVPTFKLSVTLPNLNRFSKRLHWWKAYETCYKTVWHYSPHIRHVATLHWNIKNSNLLQMWQKMQTNCIF